MNQTRHKRRIKLIRPRLQLKLIGWFLGIASMALLLQYLVLGMYLNELAESLPESGALVASEAGGMLLRSLAISFLFLLPVTLAVGVLVTFRIAGPVYRFETHLSQIARGEEVGPCRLREGDELKELCEKLNLAVATLSDRQDSASADESSPERALERIG